MSKTALIVIDMINSHDHEDAELLLTFVACCRWGLTRCDRRG
ncbi:cysteine hydrolase, partial [Streptomyces sp. NPDC042638]